jgi:hypothetical protein
MKAMSKTNSLSDAIRLAVEEAFRQKLVTKSAPNVPPIKRAPKAEITSPQTPKAKKRVKKVDKAPLKRDKASWDF